VGVRALRYLACNAHALYYMVICGLLVLPRFTTLCHKRLDLWEVGKGYHVLGSFLRKGYHVFGFWGKGYRVFGFLGKGYQVFGFFRKRYHVFGFWRKGLSRVWSLGERVITCLEFGGRGSEGLDGGGEV
jgi:hypothetical protein